VDLKDDNSCTLIDYFIVLTATKVLHQQIHITPTHVSETDRIQRLTAEFFLVKSGDPTSMKKKANNLKRDIYYT
jgi:hypothetical protein